MRGQLTCEDGPLVPVECLDLLAIQSAGNIKGIFLIFQLQTHLIFTVSERGQSHRHQLSAERPRKTEAANVKIILSKSSNIYWNISIREFYFIYLN